MASVSHDTVTFACLDWEKYELARNVLNLVFAHIKNICSFAIIVLSLLSLTTLVFNWKIGYELYYA